MEGLGNRVCSPLLGGGCNVGAGPVPVPMAATLRGLKLQRERTVCFVVQRAEELSTKRNTGN